MFAWSTFFFAFRTKYVRRFSPQTWSEHSCLIPCMCKRMFQQCSLKTSHVIHKCESDTACHPAMLLQQKNTAYQKTNWWHILATTAHYKWHGTSRNIAMIKIDMVAEFRSILGRTDFCCTTWSLRHGNIPQMTKGKNNRLAWFWRCASCRCTFLFPVQVLYPFLSRPFSAPKFYK